MEHHEKHTQVNATGKILSYTYPPSQLEMTKPSKPDRVVSWYQFHIGCKAADFTDECKIVWSTDNNYLDIGNITSSGKSFGIYSLIYVTVSQNSTKGRISCHLVCTESTVNIQQHFIVDLPTENSAPIRFAWIASVAATSVVVLIAAAVITVKDEEQGATGSDIVYADLDIDFLEKCRAFATKPDCYEPTEYADVTTTLKMRNQTM
ncbi:hypothetical protein DPMN_102136 [Dreissena polymorpha]|uniref:Uncharacterized protein n=1 Tax=Dreissena polymorpha TaxID=45954 RepID=A0A9D4LK51_DREPO|nr:hypothetical protein DPMN_102136 [Dreissena polymorpha]